MKYYSINSRLSEPFELKEKGSQFLAYGFRCESMDAFEEQLQLLKKEHYTASHHCYAWRIDPEGPEEFAQDDGEPSGTAGLPILNQMKSAHLCNSAVVVVRYFGGTKLGKPGLISAYGGVAAGCLKVLPKQQLQAGRLIYLRFEYPQKRIIEDLIAHHSGVIAESNFTDKVTYTLKLPADGVEDAQLALKKMAYLGVRTEEGGKVLMYT
jgi:uncharacterized YigZ family protein